MLKLMASVSTKTPEDKARDGLQSLRNKCAPREGKYIRNLNRYNNNGVRREDLWTPYGLPQAYVTPAQNTDGVQTQFNLIKSCADTLTSKISQANVRPFFNPLNGDYDTDRACKSLQQHFDFWLDEQHAYPKSILCFRDAAVCDMGVMQVDSEFQSLDHVPPWEYFVDPGEYTHHALTHVMRWRKFFPLAALTSKIENEKLKQLLANDLYSHDEYAEYYDLYSGNKWEFYGSELVREPMKLDYSQYGGLYRRPFIECFYTKPMKGFWSVSLADDLYPIQRQVDELVRRFDNATRSMPLAIGFVPKGSGLKATQIGNAVTLYDVLSGSENGQVQFITPNPMSQEWLNLLEMYMSKAYELSGISKMSAQSKKPADVESGKALQTLEDVESDRFNVQLQQHTHFLVDIARVCIDVFPAGKTILPPKIMRDDITWGEARNERDKYSIQFSAASILSKDPDKKMAQVQAMINGGFIDRSMASHFMQLPDLEGVFTVTSANFDAAERIVQDCIEGHELEFWETVDLTTLTAEIVKKINILIAVQDDQKYIRRLAELLEKVTEAQKEVVKLNTPPAPPAPPPEPMKDKAFDSGQVTGLLAVIAQVNSGAIHSEQAAALIANMFPSFAQESIAMLVKPNPQAVAAGIPGALPSGSAPQGAPAPAPVGNPTAGVNNA